MSEDTCVGVVNPYALAEYVYGKRINWDSVDNPDGLLSEIFNLEPKEIMDVKNPILSPKRLIEEDGTEKILSEEEAKKRIEKFLSSRTHNITRRMSLRNVTAVNKRIMEGIFPEKNKIGEPNNTPWMPEDMVWADKGDYFEDVAELFDPIQGALADCYFISAMCSVAWARPYAIINAARPSAVGDDNNPIHYVYFFKNGKGTPEKVEVTELIPVRKTTLAYKYARSVDNGEVWPAVMEKAYAKWKTSNTTDRPNLESIAYGNPVLACAELIGGTMKSISHKSASIKELTSFVKENCRTMRTFNPMVAWTASSAPSGLDFNDVGLVGNHAYSILGWTYSNGENYVVLRNPWGSKPATVDTIQGIWQPYNNSYYERITFGANGIFAFKFSTFKKYFSESGVVK